MTYLQSKGVVIFLEADLATLESRIHNFSTRGLAKQAGQTFAQLFAERQSLYRKYADITVNCAELSPTAVCAWIIAELEG